MSIFGSGVGGNIGGPQQPLQRDIEATAWTEVNKAFAGLTKDTLIVPFTKLGGNVWKYESNANRPTLHPMESLRVSLTNPELIDESWMPFFENLIQQLPPDVKEAFNEQNKRSFEERNPSFVALNHLLIATAKILLWIENTNHLLAPDSIQVAPGTPLRQRTDEYQYLPYLAIQTAIADGETIYGSAFNYLSQLGPNNPYFDALLNFNSQLKEAFDALTTLSPEFANSSIDPRTPQVHLAHALEAVNEIYHQSNLGDDLQILGPTFKALAILSAAMALEQGSPALELGINIASIGLSASQSSSGFLGQALETLSSGLSNVIEKGLLPNANVGNQLLINTLTILSFIGAISSGSLLANHGIGRLPNKEMDLVDEHNHLLFAFELTMLLASSSQLIFNTYHSAAAASGATEKNQGAIAAMLATTALFLTILSGAQGNQTTLERLTMELKGPLAQGIGQTQEFLSQALATGLLSGETASSLSVYLQQALLALNEENFNGFYDCYVNVLHLLNLTPEQVQKDIKQIGNFAEKVLSAFYLQQNDPTTAITGIAHIA